MLLCNSAWMHCLWEIQIHSARWKFGILFSRLILYFFVFLLCICILFPQWGDFPHIFLSTSSSNPLSVAREPKELLNRPSLSLSFPLLRSPPHTSPPTRPHTHRSATHTPPHIPTAKIRRNMLHLNILRTNVFTAQAQGEARRAANILSENSRGRKIPGGGRDTDRDRWVCMIEKIRVFEA